MKEKKREKSYVHETTCHKTTINISKVVDFSFIYNIKQNTGKMLISKDF